MYVSSLTQQWLIPFASVMMHTLRDKHTSSVMPYQNVKTHYLQRNSHLERKLVSVALKGVEQRMRTLLLRCLVLLISMGIVSFISATPLYAATTPPLVIYHGNSAFREIALTFDDGPNPIYGPQIQGELKRYNVPATFFYVGQQVQRYPTIAAQAHNAGFIIGNHSWDHADLTHLSSTQVQSEFTETSNAIFKATGVTPTLMRPPYGAVNSAIENQSAQLGMSTILWDIDPQDWKRPGTNAIVQNVVTHIHNGAIILMHEGGGDRSQTVAALVQIIPALRLRGYHFVTIPQMIADLHMS